MIDGWNFHLDVGRAGHQCCDRPAGNEGADRHAEVEDSPLLPQAPSFSEAF